MPRTYKPQNDGLSYREFAADRSTVDIDSRSINGVAATEQAVLMPDWDRYEMVPEVLLMSGARFGDSVPLLNNHRRWDADDVIGTAGELRTSNKQLLTRATFSSESESIWAKVREGHIRDLSVGYRVEKKRYIAKDKSERIAGREFSGPMNVVTSWTVCEVSVTPIGADDQAKLRGFSGNPFGGGDLMLNQEQRDKLVARGMPADLDDAAAVAWSIDNPEVRTVEKIVEKPVEVRGADDPELFSKFKDELKAEREAERKLHSFIRETCRKNGLDDKVQEVIDTCSNELDAGRAIFKLLEERQATVHPSIGRFDAGPSSNEKLGDVVRSAVLNRAFEGIGVRGEKADKFIGKRAQGWEDFRHARLLDIASVILNAEGVRTFGMAPQDIAKAALGFSGFVGRSGGFHVSGMFQNILLDAINKTMLSAYGERAMTYQQVFRQAASAADFKNIYRIRMSEAANLSIWPDNTTPEEIAFSDEKETYAVEAYSNIASFSWRTLVNDDMDAFSRVPQLMGRAAVRTVNAAVWSQVTSNPTMQDGVALFSNTSGARKQDNLSSGTVTVANLALAKALMRLMTGVNTKGGNASPAILGIQPRYLVVPATIETTAQQVVRSVYDPAAAAGTGVYNPFYNTLELVVEPLLDGTSTAEWYLFSDTADIDTIEYTFLQGQETPVVSSWTDEETSALKYKIVQTFAAKAIDHRGCVKSTGS